MILEYRVIKDFINNLILFFYLIDEDREVERNKMSKGMQ